MAIRLNMRAFLSYQTAEKSVAGRIKESLELYGIRSFLAHEDIGVSQEWATRILSEIKESEIFVCVLSENYLASPWCIQESGIAANRGMTVVPLTVDRTTPPGFLSQYQGRRIDPTTVSIRDLAPGLVQHDGQKGINLIIDLIKDSRSYRTAEANFQLVMPYVDDLNESQGRSLLLASHSNDQVHNAGLCVQDYLPEVIGRYGHLVDPVKRDFLEERCRYYAR